MESWEEHLVQTALRSRHNKYTEIRTNPLITAITTISPYTSGSRSFKIIARCSPGGRLDCFDFPCVNTPQMSY